MAFDTTNKSLHGEFVRYRLIILGLMVLLLSAGFANLYSATEGSRIFYNQLKIFLLCLPIFFIVSKFFTSKIVKELSIVFFIITCVLLLLVLAVGHTSKGSTRWLDLYFFKFQPSEIAKIAVILLVARFFSTFKMRAKHFRLWDLKFLGLGIGIIFTLIAVEPDLGTAGLCILIASAQIFFVRLNLKSLGAAFLAFLSSFALGWIFLFKDYQKKRILTFLNPQLDPFGDGYNIQQSLITIGSGRVWGKGYFDGSQSKLHFLPERHNDFALPVFAEEQGFIITCFLLLSYFLLSFIILEVGRRSRDLFSQIALIGIAANFFIQFSINCAMVLGMFPVVGMPLPLFSQGGSSLIVCILEISLVMVFINSALKNGNDSKVLSSVSKNMIGV